MKKITFFFTILLVWSTALYAQNPRPYLYAGAGTWRDWLTYYDAYGSDYHHWQPQMGLGVGLDMRITDYVSFAPEAGLEYFQMRYDYHNSKSPRYVESDLGLFYGRLSPGIALHPTKALSIRFAVTTLVSAFTIGEYDLITKHIGTWDKDTVNISNDYGRIRNPIIGGPELNVGYDFRESQHGRFGIRVSSFIGVKGVFRETFYTVLNPLIFQLRANLVYTFPAKGAAD